MFSRVAVVNRGEPAVRLIRAVRELNERARPGHPGHRSAHRGRASSALRTSRRRGGVPARCPRPRWPLPRPRRARTGAGREPSRRCVGGLGVRRRGPALRRAVRTAGRALHRSAAGGHAPARRQDRGQAARRAVRGTGRAHGAAARCTALEDAAAQAGRIGYPLIVKARSGGGGRGIRLVGAADELEDAFERTRAEAARTFGDPVVFLERLVVGGRHIEVQIIADDHGSVWAPGVRDCSIQRRNQKLVEESSSPALTAEQEAGLCAAAIELVRAAGYRGAGTVEFLYQPDREVVRLPGGEHPAAGRAPGDRGDDRARPGQAAAARGRRRAAGGRAAAARSATPSRPGSTPRTPSRASRRRLAGWSCCGCPPAQASGSTPGSARATSSRRTTTRWSPRSSPGGGTARRRWPGCGAPCARPPS